MRWHHCFVCLLANIHAYVPKIICPVSGALWATCRALLDCCMGNLLLTQAAYHGVPIVGMPLWGEQPDNVARAVEQGHGTCVSIDDTHNLARDLQTALQRVLGNPSFAGNASRVSRLIQATRDSPARQAAGMTLPSSFGDAFGLGVFWVCYMLTF